MAPMHMLISAHRDGRIIADAVSLFRRSRSIAGSTRRGGSGGVAADAEEVERQRLRRSHTGRPARSGNDRQHRHRQRRRGWHRCRSCRSPTRRAGGVSPPAGTGFIVALPFGRGRVPVGRADRDRRRSRRTALEHAAPLVEERMVDIGEEADRRVGHPGPPQSAEAPMQSPGLGERSRRSARSSRKRCPERHPFVMLPLVYRALTGRCRRWCCCICGTGGDGARKTRAPARAPRFDPDCAAAGAVDLDTRRQRRRGDVDATR